MFQNKKRLVTIILLLLMAAFFFISRSHDNIKTLNINDNSLRFVVMGDSQDSSWGANEHRLRELLENIQYLTQQPKFILFSGDMIYGGHYLDEELDSWKYIVEDYFPINKCYPAMGNHEQSETVFSNVLNYLPNEQLPSYQRTVYYFDYNDARFIVLNSIHRDYHHNYVIDKQQQKWLEQHLASSDKTFNFVIFHVPAYPIGSHYNESLDANPSQRDALWSIIDKYNVAAVFVGHEHNYNRRLINSSFSSSPNNFKNDIYQITLGGAGAPLNNYVTDRKNVKVGPVATYHYLVVDIKDNTAKFNVFDINNEIIDSFEIKR